MEGVGSVGGGTGTGGGGRAVGGGESARVSPSLVTVGARQRFEVKLRPGETTIVSWKKLVKDASKVKGPAVVPEAPAIAHPALESRIASGQPAENEANDAPPASRFSAVIEKIERLYMGKNSSDEEDLNDVPDDDEYDTEDSFIDDTELDEYFQVDNSAIKHDGFFVNRGKLERTNDPTLSSNQQPKKRRRKDLAKDHGGSDGGHVPNKHVKVGKKAAGSSMPLVENSNITSNCMAIPTVNCDDVKLQNQTSASEFYSKMKTTGTKTTLDPSPLRVSNGDSIADGKDIDKQKAGVAPSKNHINKLKDGSEFFDASHQRSNDKISYAQCKSQSGRLLNNEEELDQSVQQKEKKNIRERSDINVPEGKNSMQTAKAPPTQKKEGSNVKPNNTMLETAIGELEKMVAESRPPSMEVSGADILSQAVKKRMPPEIKQKLAKVARLAQDGKISKELLLNRLMSIVGHLTQLSTLKRNLTTMVNKGLSAKREKDARVQQVKMQVEEMIKCRVQVLVKQAGASDDFQEIRNEEKEVLKRKCGMDEPLEDKICYLYDLFVEGLEEDAGPQVRKLYAEVAELWPKGLMDKHGVRRAICRSKDRKREKYSGYKVQEKLKKKKLITKTNKRAQVAASSVSQSQYVQALVADSGNHGSILVNRPVSNPTAANTAPQMPITITNGPNVDLPKQDKVKGNFSSSNDVAKKKEKKKPELDLGEAQIRPEKLNSAQGEEKHKSHKQVAGPPQKTNLQLAAPPPPSFEQHS